jgi:hypothetical protein
VSGFAAWVLISLKRPFRPGDRVQFPNLGLTGDVKDIGIMYTVLDQVGGTIGSEEAVGRHILVPNAMLFSQVVINYTVHQEAAHMLDEVVIRITYDSDWEEAEKILLNAAQELTKEIILATGVQPYIRSDLYDYGVFMRLRYKTRVMDRPEIASRITKKVFEDIQKTPEVDIAIPFVYSFRAGADKKEDEAIAREEAVAVAVAPDDPKSMPKIREIAIEKIQEPSDAPEQAEIEQLAQRIKAQGLLQPILLLKLPDEDRYEILAGHLRFQACRKLDWRTIPAIVRDAAGQYL